MQRQEAGIALDVDADAVHVEIQGIQKFNWAHHHLPNGTIQDTGVLGGRCGCSQGRCVVDVHDTNSYLNWLGGLKDFASLGMDGDHAVGEVVGLSSKVHTERIVRPGR